MDDVCVESLGFLDGLGELSLGQTRLTLEAVLEIEVVVGKNRGASSAREKSASQDKAENVATTIHVVPQNIKFDDFVRGD